MNKQQQNMDLVTSGRQPSEQDFAQISAWIRQQKKKTATRKPKVDKRAKKDRAQQRLLR